MRSAIDFQHILHARGELAVSVRRNHPVLTCPLRHSVFLSVLRTVSWLIESAISSMTICSASNLSDQLANPAGGLPNRNAMTAAHPTLPFLAQGACLAIEDAWVLAECLAAAPDMAAGLAHYEARRLPRARRVVAASARNARRFHLRSPWREVAQTALRFGGSVVGRGYDWIYAADVTAGD